jgi:GNAT superfamily N-acetyltransferase
MIRRATPDDADALASVNRESITALCGVRYSDEELAAWTAGIDPTMYDAAIDAENIVVAVEDDTIVGFAVADPSESMVKALFVAPDAARRGVGRSLMAAVEERLLHAGVGDARLNASFNAVPFYEALGYSALGQTTHRLRSGVELPCTAMRKRLRSPG